MANEPILVSQIPKRVVKKLIEVGSVRVTLYPDIVEIIGGLDSDDVILQINGTFTKEQVAEWFDVDPSHIEIEDKW
jgi:hypothetical protein